MIKIELTLREAELIQDALAYRQSVIYEAQELMRHMRGAPEAKVLEAELIGLGLRFWKVLDDAARAREADEDRRELAPLFSAAEDDVCEPGTPAKGGQ